MGRNISSLFELVALDEVDSVVMEAGRLAKAGAEEGTLVWAGRQSKALGRSGKPWYAPEGNLHGALVLQPESDLATAVQLCLVGVVAMGSAFANVMPPLTEIRYRWPNDILIDGHRVASFQMAIAESQPRPEWLVLGFSVNIKRSPKQAEFPATTLEAEGGDVITSAELLESFSRHFLSWGNRWAGEGLVPVAKAWMLSAYLREQSVQVALKSGVEKGVFTGLTGDGELLLNRDDSSTRRISITEYFSW